MKKRWLSLVLALCMVLTLMPVGARASHTVVMSSTEFINYLQYVVNRGDSQYGSGDQKSVGKYDGTHIYFDCWGLGESIICTKGQIVYNRNTSLNPWSLWDTSCGCGSYDGDWLKRQCKLSSDFTNLVPGEWLFIDNANGYCYHVGYYIGNGKVIESTTDGSYNTQVSSIDNRGHSNLRGSSWAWTYHGKVPWISYSDGPDPVGPSDTLSFSNYNTPSTLNVGDVFSIYGIIDSGSTISSVTVGVYDTSGNMATGKTVNPGSTTYNIHNVDNYILFNNLSAGTYYYRVTATNGSGTKVLLNHQFVVKDPYVPPALSASASSVSLNLKGTNTATITYTASGSLPDWYTLKGEVSNSCIITSWGSWNGSSCPLNIEGKKVGNCTITINLCDANDIVFDTTTVQVTVDTKYCTVTLDANGGSVDPSSMQIEQGNSIVNLPDAARTDYHFDGWYTAASGGSQITSSTVFNSNQTIYAHWTPVCSHQWQTVNYSADAANKKPGVQASICVYCGSVKSLIVTPFASVGSMCRTHDYVTDFVVRPNCRQVGLILSYCKNCGAENINGTPQGLPYGDHDLNFVVTAAPGCAWDGTGYAECSVCGKTIDVDGPATAKALGASTSEVNMFKATGHNFETAMSAVDLNGDGVLNITTVNGVRDIIPKTTATHCETVDGNRILNSNGSVMGTFAVGVDGMGSGYTGDRVCNGCGTVLYGEIIDSLNSTHKSSERTSTGFLPYTDSNGDHVDGRTDTYYCSGCSKHFGGSRIDYDEYFGLAKEGDTKVIGTVDATCDNNGYTGDHYKFSGNKWVLVQYGEMIPALGHDFVTIADKTPSCTESGYHFENGKICTRCGIAQYDNYTILPPAGHTWGEWVLTKAATASAPGEETRTCSVCGETETREVPYAEHIHSLTAVAKADATCTEDGAEAYWKCSGCGKLFSDAEGNNEIKAPVVIPATGHSCIVVNKINPTCTKAGRTGSTVCKNCGLVLEYGEDIPALGHTWGEWVLTKAATASAPGEETRSCSVCGETETREVPYTAELAITKQPENFVGEEDSPVTFTVEAVGEGLTYKWQFSDNGGKKWTTSSIKTAEYPTMLAANRDGRQIRCIVTDQYGNTVTSDTATMKLYRLAITKQPENYVGAEDSPVTFRVEAIGEGLSYKWQFSDNGGQKWTTSSIKTAEYPTLLAANRDGRLIRCIVKDQYGNSVTSDIVTMRLYKLAITKQPVDFMGKEDSPVTFYVEAVGDGLTYQWQFSDNGGKKWTKSSVKTAEYATMLAANRDGRQIRCIVKDQYGNSVTSNVATMRLYKLAITKQPVDYVGKVNTTASFTVEAIGVGLTYKWQYSDNGGAKWTTSSVSTPTYSARLTSAKNGRLVRCIVTDAYDKMIISDAVAMRVGAFQILEQPQSVVAKENSTVTFKVAAEGEGLTYQWQYSDNGGKKWTTSNVTAQIYSARLTSIKNGRLVRCIITDANGNSVTSGAARMTIG